MAAGYDLKESVSHIYPFNLSYLIFKYLDRKIFFWLFRATPATMEVPRLGVKSEL